ncbi:MAG: c-type cytochrome [Rhodospirillaceae bacterium]|nr:c-type cytochrome [Rhodospirillaceae bacterium]
MKIAVGLILTMFVPNAQAATVGEMLSASCWSCHGPRGASPGAIPPLQGLTQDRIAADMSAYRTGQKSGTVMPAIARGYDDVEIAAIAAYVASSVAAPP